MRISTHTPRVGRDSVTLTLTMTDFISTHTPRVGRDSLNSATYAAMRISTHTPRVGRDYANGEEPDELTDFNSHAPCGA